MSVSKKRISRLEKINLLAEAKAEFLSLDAQSGELLIFSSDPESGLPKIGDECFVGSNTKASGDYTLMSGDKVQIRNGVVVTLQRKADSPAVQLFQKRAQQSNK